MKPLPASAAGGGPRSPAGLDELGELPPSLNTSVDYDRTPSFDFDTASLDSIPYPLPAAPSLNHAPIALPQPVPPNSAGAQGPPSPVVVTPKSTTGRSALLRMNNRLGRTQERTLHKMTPKQHMRPATASPAKRQPIAVNTVALAPPQAEVSCVNANLTRILDARGLQQGMGLYVTDLNLHANRIADMGQVSQLINLEKLNLSSNQIREVSGLQPLHGLAELNLSSNRLRAIQPGALSGQTGLERLSLAYNSIGDLAGLAEGCFQTARSCLTHLDLRDNRIASVEALRPLQHISTLQSLQLSGYGKTNSVCHEPDYHAKIACMLPQIAYLDDLPVLPPLPSITRPTAMKSAKRPPQLAIDASAESPAKFTPRIDNMLQRFYKRSGRGRESPAAPAAQPRQPRGAGSDHSGRIARLEKTIATLSQRPQTAPTGPERGVIVPKPRPKGLSSICTQTPAPPELSSTACQTEPLTPRSPPDTPVSEKIYIASGNQVAADGDGVELLSPNTKQHASDEMVKMLRAELGALELACQELESAHERDVAQAATAKERNEQDLSAARSDAQAKGREAEALQRRVEDLVRGGQLTEERLRAEQERAAMLQRQLEEERSSCARMREDAQSLDTSTKLAQGHASQASELLRQQTEAHKAQLAELKRELTEGHKRQAKLEAEMAQAQGQAARTQELWDADKAHWQRSLEQLKQSSQELQADRAGREAKLKEDLGAREARVRALEAEITTLENDFRVAIRAETQNRMVVQAAFQKSTQDCAELKRLLQAALDAEANLKKALGEMNDVMKRQTEKTLILTAAVESGEQTIARLRGEAGELGTRAQAGEMAKQHADILAKHLEETRGETKQAREKCQALEQANLELAARVEELEIDLSRQCTSGEQSRSALDGLRTQLQTAEAAVKIKLVQLEDQNKQIARLKDSVEEGKVETVEAETRYKDASREWDGREEEFRSYIEELKEDRAKLKEELETLQDSKTAIEGLQRDLGDAKKAVEALKLTKVKGEEKLRETLGLLEQMQGMVEEEREKHHQAVRDRDTHISGLERELDSLQGTLTTQATKLEHQIQTLHTQLRAESSCRKDWESRTKVANDRVIKTEQEMRVILQEMDRQKKATLAFAAALNIHGRGKRTRQGLSGT